MMTNRKTIENVRQHRGITLFTTERRSNYLVSEPNYHTTKCFHRTSISNRIEKTEILMNKPVYLRLSILELSKILIHGFWYDYIKPNYGKKAKVCYTDTDSLIVYIKTNDIYKNIAEDIGTTPQGIN